MKLTAAATLSLLALGALSARAQAVAQPETYRFDLGGGLGLAGYMGDASGANPFSSPGLSGSLSFRYLANSRLALRTVLAVSGLSGSTASIPNSLPEGKVYDFSSTLTDLTVRGEFNFFNYGIGETYKGLTPLSPYLALGAGLSVAATADGPYAAMTLPMALGVKYKLRPRLNLSAEMCVTKVFGDHIDSAALSDLSLIKSSFIKNTDWYSSISLSLTYEFGKRCVTCHRID